MNKRVTKKTTVFLKKPLVKLHGGFDRKRVLYINTSLVFLFTNISLIIFIFVIIQKLPPEMPLFYGLPRGEEQLGAALSLIIPLLLSSVFVVINSILAYFITSLFLKKVLVVGSYFTAILSIITVVRIISLVVNFK